MSNFYARYPSDAGASSNLSVGTNGATAPTSSTEVAGIDNSGNLHPLQTDSSGRLIVSIGSGLTNPLPVTDAAAEASLASIDTKTPTVGQKTMAASSPVVIASDQSAIAVTGPLTDTQLRATPVPVSASALPLPTGAATAANQATEIASLASIDTKLTSPLAVTGPLTDTQLRASAVPVSAAALPLPSGAATAANQATEIASLASIDTKLTSPLTVTGTVAATQSGTWNINNVSGTVSLPTGAATAANQTTLSAQIPTTLGQKTSANSLAVVISSDQSAITTTSTQAGYTRANAPVTIASYSSTPVTTAAYTQLVASTSNATKQVQIFDSSGQAMILATGAAASEVDFVYIPPGGGIFNLAIAAATRVSLKALTATASSGYFIISFLG